jgi:hypothetical protein
MIVVLGRPRVYRSAPDGALLPGGLPAEIALALGRSGAGVELVGSIGDDPEGDRIVVELGRAGVGHAALLRDPSARTPPTGPLDATRPLPHLGAAEVELGLRYVAECRVLVLADVLGEDALAQALEAAAYHAAALVMVAPPGSIDPEALGDNVTLLERPALDGLDAWDAPNGSADDVTDDPSAAAGDAAPAAGELDFAGLVADYAARLDAGELPAPAFAAALGDRAWEPAPE